MGVVSLYSALKKKPLASKLNDDRACPPLLAPSSSSPYAQHEEEKKPAGKTLPASHGGRDGREKSREEQAFGGREVKGRAVGGISSMAALRQSDVFFTGSENGEISMWSVRGGGGEEEEGRFKKNRLNGSEDKKTRRLMSGV